VDKGAFERQGKAFVGGGSPAGVGSARTPPIYLKPGDLSVCSYEGIGTLTNPVVASGK
jgi:2-keto-4-pentenoate hydratase/2-oxohepta-3-ene-1,7-dioic acid hydratase in catechol pathway